MQSPTINNSEIVKQFYRKTKLVHKNQVKTIWEATHIYTGDVVIAKIQTLNESANQRTLLHEGKFLQSCQGSPGIPFLFWCGKDELQKQAVLIEQKLGKTLKHLTAESPNNTLSLKSTIMIGIQLIKALACYHEKGYIHRNISLDTVQFGVGSRCDKLYLNDFIESRSFYKKGTLQHIDKKTGIKLKKGNEFTSCDVLDGIEPSRKDDMESVILLLICLLKGKLPWSDLWTTSSNENHSLTNQSKNSVKGIHYSQKKEYIQQKSEQKILILERKKSGSPSKNNKINSMITHNRSKSIINENEPYPYPSREEDRKTLEEILNIDRIQSKKIDKRIESTKKIMKIYHSDELCDSLPKEIGQILNQIRNLNFTEKPNYLLYIQKLNGVLIREGIENDGIYDWMSQKSIRQSVQKGGLSVKHYEWLIRGEDGKSKLTEFENEGEVMGIYEKLAPFIELDRLVSM